jgi:hypothetical protein
VLTVEPTFRVSIVIINPVAGWLAGRLTGWLASWQADWLADSFSCETHIFSEKIMKVPHNWDGSMQAVM